MDLGEEIAALLRTERLGRQLRFHREIASTNSEALRLGREGAEHGTLVVADRQTAGRGRRGRSWSSPGGVNLYLSLLLRPTIPPRFASQIVPTVAVALAETIRALDLEAAIKWPNDLEIGGRKVAGILTELSAAADRIHFVVVGIGINVNAGPADLPEELWSIATSLRACAGRTLDRAQLGADLLLSIERWLAVLEERGFAPVKERYGALSSTLGRRVRLVEADREIEGIAEAIDDTGAILLRRDDGALEPARTGDVTSLRPAR